MSASNKEMEERRAHGFRVRPSYSQVLGYIAEGEPLPINPQSSEPEPAPLPHATVDPAAGYEDANEGYDGVPFPRRDFLRPRPFDLDSESDFGAVDPGQALRNDGLNPHQLLRASWGGCSRPRPLRELQRDWRAPPPP